MGTRGVHLEQHRAHPVGEASVSSLRDRHAGKVAYERWVIHMKDGPRIASCDPAVIMRLIRSGRARDWMGTGCYYPIDYDPDPDAGA